MRPGHLHRVGGPPDPGVAHQLGRHALLGRHVLEAVGVRLVQPGAQPFGEPPRVGEHDGRAVREDEVEDPFLHGRPDRRRRFRAGAGAGLGLGLGLGEAGHVRHRYDHVDSQGLSGRRVDHRDLAGTPEEARDLLGRAHGRRQTHPLCRSVQQRVETFQAQGKVSAAFGTGHGVHLVHDDRLHPTQRLACPAGQDQEQRLGRGDEYIWWETPERPPLGSRSVTGPDAHPHVGFGPAEARRGSLDPRERGSQVAFDVHGQRLERADVEHAAAPGGFRRWVGAGDPVQRPQKGGECLARAGRGDDQDVVPVADRLPRACLRGSGRGEHAFEPGPGGG